MAIYGVDYGMTDEGFIPKRLTDIIQDIKTNMGQIAHPDTSEMMFRDVTDTDDAIWEQVVGVIAAGIAQCWEAAYDASVQFDPGKNSGAGQAGTVQLNAIMKKTGSATILSMVLGGIPGTVVPADSKIASAADGELIFATVMDAEIGADGTAFVDAICATDGPVEPEAGTIVQIMDSLPGWQGAVNSSVVSLGTPGESDDELRRRQQRSTSLTSYRQIDAIYAAILNVPGVVWCRVYQNDFQYPYDKRGIPFKEVAAVVEGGDEREIAEALFKRFPVAVNGYGNTALTLYDNQGDSYAIAFSRPVDVPIWVEVNLAVTKRAEFPDDYEQAIAHAIMEYARYGDGDNDGFPPGADILNSRLYTPVNRVNGHAIQSIKLGLAKGAVAETDIPIAWNKVGRFSRERIKVTMPTAREDMD